LDKDKNKKTHYIFSTSIDSSYDRNQEEFIVELFSCLEDGEVVTKPDVVIRNFDELISFFENLDEEHNSNIKIQKDHLVKTK
jgi:hypothetical protein